MLATFITSEFVDATKKGHCVGGREKMSSNFPKRVFFFHMTMPFNKVGR